MDPVVFTIFKKEEVLKINEKLKKMLLNSATQGRSNYTLFEMYKFKPEEGVVYDLFSVFKIFIPEETYQNLMSKFIHLNSKTINQTIFEYKNMKLIKQDGRFLCEKYLDEDHIIGDGHLNKLTHKKMEDPSMFSCRDDIKSREIIETRFKVAENAPIFFSFIHDKLLDKFYYRLWFDIADDIDDILDALC